jgi:hypothetical protein
MADDRRIAWLALILFVGGLILPFAAYPCLTRLAELPHQRAAVLSAAIGATCELLALALGIVGRRHLPGKIAGVGSGVLISLTVIGLATWVLR